MTSTSPLRDGARCADLAAAVVHRLGSTGCDGALGRGLDYPAQFPALARLDAGSGCVVIDFAGLDDVSAVRARALDPLQDACWFDDVDTVRARSGEVALWFASAGRPRTLGSPGLRWWGRTRVVRLSPHRGSSGLRQRR